MSIYPVRFFFESLPAAAQFAGYMEAEDPFHNERECLLYLYDMHDYWAIYDSADQQAAHEHIQTLHAQVEHWVKEAAAFGSLTWAYASSLSTDQLASADLDVNTLHQLLQEAVQTRNGVAFSNVFAQGLSAWQVVIRKDVAQQACDIDFLRRTVAPPPRRDWSGFTDVYKSASRILQTRPDAATEQRKTLKKLRSDWPDAELPGTFLDALLRHDYRARYDGRSYYRLIGPEYMPPDWKTYGV